MFEKFSGQRMKILIGKFTFKNSVIPRTAEQIHLLDSLTMMGYQLLEVQ